MLQYYAPRINLGILVIGITLLVLIAVICGYRKSASGIRYWTLAAAKVSIAFILWQILSFFMFPIIMVYTSGPGELRLFLIDIASLIIFIILSLLLIFVESRLSP
jgi:hypothetical protein